jgi:hypothetical protein
MRSPLGEVPRDRQIVPIEDDRRRHGQHVLAASISAIIAKRIGSGSVGHAAMMRSNAESNGSGPVFGPVFLGEPCFLGCFLFCWEPKNLLLIRGIGVRSCAKVDNLIVASPTEYLTIFAEILV